VRRGITSRSGALSEPPFRRFFTGQAASLLGDGMAPVALAFAVIGLGGSPTELGLVLAAQALPLVAFLLVGGVFADRLPRRGVMLGADVVRGLAQSACAVLLVTGHAEIWMLAALQVPYGAASAFFNPAMTGLTPSIVSAPRLQQANALRGLAESAGAIVGPALAATIIAVASPGWALGADAATFLVSTFALTGLRVPPSDRIEPRPFLRDLREGWSEFRARPWIVAIVVSILVGTLPAAAWRVLGPGVSEDRLGGATAWALLNAADGVGALIGGLLALGWRPARPLLVASVIILVFPVRMAMLALDIPVWPIAVASLACGLSVAFFNTVWETALQREVPAQALSRVSAYDWFGSLALRPIALAVMGPIAVGLGTDTTLWLAAGLVLVTTIAPLGLRSVRDLRDPGVSASGAT
jgi:MFS family permease